MSLYLGPAAVVLDFAAPFTWLVSRPLCYGSVMVHPVFLAGAAPPAVCWPPLVFPAPRGEVHVRGHGPPRSWVGSCLFLPSLCVLGIRAELFGVPACAYLLLLLHLAGAASFSLGVYPKGFVCACPAIISGLELLGSLGRVPGRVFRPWDPSSPWL